ELLVGANIGRRNAQQLKLGKGVLVNVVRFGRIGPLEAFARFQVGEAHGLHDVKVTAENSDFAGLVELDQARIRHLGDAGIAAAEDGQPSDIATGAVGEAR